MMIAKKLLLLFLVAMGMQGVRAQTVEGHVFYEQTYETAGVAADWTTSVAGRYTPTILEDAGNHYLSVVQSTRYNNGCVLTSLSLEGKVAAGTDFVMTFDLKVSSSTNQSPTTFAIYDAANSATMFSLTATGTNATSWMLNGATSYTLPDTNKGRGDQSVSDIPWYTVKLKRVGTETYVTITPKAGGAAVVDNAHVSASTTGGLGKMTFTTMRYYANFAIDNICVTSLFSYSSESVAVDITRIGMDDHPDMSSLMPQLVNEVSGEVTATSYSSSNTSVALATGAAVYLVGVGTTTIATTQTIGGTNYTSSYELTVSGSRATVAQSVDDDTETGKTTALWTLSSDGLVDRTYSLGVATLTTAFGSETPVAVNDGYGAAVLRVVDANGYTHTNTDGGSLHEDAYGGTFYRLDLAQAGQLTIWGTGGDGAILLSALSTTATVAASSTNSTEGSSAWTNLSPGTYYLYNTSLRSFQFTYETPRIAWSSNIVTVNINDVGVNNPNRVAGLPTLTKGATEQDKTETDGSGVAWNHGYGSSNPAVAIFMADGSVLITGVGETVMKALVDGGDVNTESDVAAYKLVVTGNTVTHTITGGNTLSFDDEGVIGKDLHTATLSATGLTVSYGHADETSLVTTYDGMTVLKIIDANGYSQPNLTGDGTDSNPPSTIPWEGAAGGTFVKLNATANGYLIVTGHVSSTATKLYKWGTATPTPMELTPDFNAEKHTMSVTLTANVAGDNYYLYNTDPGDGTYIPPVHAISYVPGFFENAYETVRLEDIGIYEVQTVNGFSDAAVYTVDAVAGTVGTPSISDGKLTGVTGGGAIRIKATENANVATYVLTVAYPATPYPGKLWHFNDSTSLHADITNVPAPVTASGDFTARYKNANNSRDARWFYNRAVAGDNAFVVGATAGLLFNTAAGGFYMRNDDKLWRHVGIFRQNASFTIPRLKAGDVVELNWKRDAESSGATFTASNLTDLRGKAVSGAFVITGSRNSTTVDRGGWTSFVVANDGDVTFTLADNGYTDLLSVRIYSGGYRPTMSPVNLYDGGTGTTAPTTLLLDGAERSVTLNYSNPLRGTATGPAMYVLKGYRAGSDPTECVTGANAQKTPAYFTDDDAYPVTAAEQERLYAQRQHLEGFRMYNQTWQSDNNSYNNGVIAASGGYGKVTVRLNNYTNDMQYVIGYTPDYTLTFGSAPHQSYPFTWDFTNISGGAVKGRSNNAITSISTDYLTWTNLGYETYRLDTNSGGGSFYVPGAKLVSAARSLGEQGSVNTLNNSGQGNDELNGLGFSGQIAFKVAQQGDEPDDAPESLSGAAMGSLLAYRMDDDAVDAAYLAQLASDGDKTVWTPAELTAGDGKVVFGSPGKREGSSVDSHTKVYRLDSGNTKNVLLIPERPFQEGDQIRLTGYSSANVALSGFSFYAGATDNAANALVTLNWPAGTAADKETTISYTVSRGDGLAGRSQVYLFRAGKAYTVLLSEVSISGPDNGAPAAYAYRERAITCVETVQLTIPDLTAGQYVYVHASDAPSAIDNLVAADSADGLDAANGVSKYVVYADGPAIVTFAAGTRVYRIGVTGITKALTCVGSGDAWATESRPAGVTQDAAIDYTQTGLFTVNAIKAHTVSATKYTTQNVVVRLNELTAAVPAETGVVLRLDLAADGAPANLAKAKDGNAVPLFAPPHSVAILSTGAVGFGGTQGNMMKANVEAQTFAAETEVVSGVDYTRFVLAQRYMTWQKVGDAAATPSSGFVASGNVPVFYRLHLYDSTEAAALNSTEAELNILGANKAYMLVPTANVPDALWKDSDAHARRYIGIEGVSGVSEVSESTEHSFYDLSGRAVDGTLRPGVYIRDGRKVIIRRK